MKFEKIWPYHKREMKILKYAMEIFEIFHFLNLKLNFFKIFIFEINENFHLKFEIVFGHITRGE
jgi:hypothetical protein